MTTGILITKDYKQFTIAYSSAKDGEQIPVKFKDLDRVLPGDQVVQGGNQKWVVSKRANHGPLVGTVDLISKVRYGFTGRNVPIYLFTPMDRSYPPFRVGCSADPKEGRNILAVVAFETWELGAGTPRGIIQHILGPVGDIAAEQEALFWFYGPNSLWTKKAVAAAKEDLAAGILADGATERYDLTDPEWNTFNCDPAGCRDIDDVFSYTSYGFLSPEIQCVITIADVAALVPTGTPTDERAFRNGQTLYPAEGTQDEAMRPRGTECPRDEAARPRHMLPTAISEEAGSLLPNETRRGLSLFFCWNPETREIVEPHFETTLVRNHETYTYEEIGNTRHAPLLENLCRILTPEADHTDTHNWVAALMIFYNKEFAKAISYEPAALLRAHSAPDFAKMEEYQQLAGPEIAALAFTAATYVPTTASEKAHYGLGAQLYTHATSPLRRYADLYNQRILKAILAGCPVCPVNPTSVAAHLNARGKAAKKHERDAFFAAQILGRPNSDRTFEGILLETSRKEKEVKLNVYVLEWKRFVALRLLAGPTDGEVISRDGKTVWQVKKGDRLSVAYSADFGKTNWRERLVFEVLATASA